MQKSGQLVGLPLEVRILGLNGVGYESGNAENCAGRSIPWLQDVPGVDVWALWQVTYRDVIILDENNAVLEIYNLTDHNLAEQPNFDALLAKLVAAATP